MASARNGGSRLEGQLLDHQERPVPNGRVRLWSRMLGEKPRIATSDELGRFVFEDVPGGFYRIWAQTDSHHGDAAFRFAGNHDPITVWMQEGFSLALTVLGADGPVEGAVLSSGDPDNTTAITDSEGRATVHGLHDFFDLVQVRADGFATAAVKVSRGPDPGGLVERTITLRSGERLSGVVEGPDGQRVPDASVMIFSLDMEFIEEARTDTDGAWKIVVPPGKYRLQARSEEFSWSPDRFVDVGSDPVSDVLVRLGDGASLTVIVTDQDGCLTAGVTVELLPADRAEVDREPTRLCDASGLCQFRGLRPAAYSVFARTDDQASPFAAIDLASDQSSTVALVVRPSQLRGVVVGETGEPVSGAPVHLMGRLSRDDLTDADGRFNLGALPSDDYRLWAQGAEWDARPGEDVTIVAKKPRAVVGRALSQGVPLTFFGVRLRPGGEKYLGSVHAVRDPDGRFCLSVHQPGSFGVELAGPGTRRKKISGLEAAPGETLDLGDIELPRGQYISGRVHDAAGNPVAGARVLLGTPALDVDLPGRWFHGNYEATTDAAGQYRFDGVAPPDYGCALAARHPAFGVSPPHPLSDRADVVVDLKLGVACGIDGMIQGFSSGLVFVHAVLLDPREVYSARVNSLGEFHFDDLPPGDYNIEMISPFKRPSPPPQTISLQPGQRQTVTLVMTHSEDPR